MLLDNIDTFWENKKYHKDLQGNIFSAEDLLILMCLHCATKRSPANNTFIFRNILDIDNIVKGGIEWNEFLQRTQNFNISSFIYFSLILTHRLYGTSIPQKVLWALSNMCSGMERFFIRIHLRCLKSFNRYSLLYSLLYKCYSPLVYSKNWIKKILWLFAVPVIFMNKEKIMLSFQLKKNSPLLFFAYYIYPFKKLFFYLKDCLHL